ncbi:hypothetical protein OTU49_016178, partial [Cherax quadricarinatus]
MEGQDETDGPSSHYSTPEPAPLRDSQVNPRTCEFNHRSCESNPRTCESNPRTCESNPRTCESNPRTCESNPRTCESNPRTCESNPRTCESSPRTCESSPRNCEPSPRTCESNPRTCATNLRPSEATPRTSETNSRTSETNLRTPETSPRTSETSPRTSETSPRTCQGTGACVTHNGGADGAPRSPLVMDSVEMGLDADSLAEDCETTASSATTVVCDSRFFCATPESPENTHLDSLDQDSGPENADEEMDSLPVIQCPGLTPARHSVSGSSQSEPSSNGPTQMGPSSNGPSPSGPSAEFSNEDNRENQQQRGRLSPPAEGECVATQEEVGSTLIMLPAASLDGEVDASFPIINTDDVQSPRWSSPSFSSGMSPPSERRGTPDLQEEQVEAYLDRHPQVVERWLRERTPMAAFRNMRGGRSLMQTDQLGKSWDSEARDTPTSGTPTDNQHLLANYSYSSRRNSISSWLSPKNVKSKKVERLTEPELFMELIRDISTELDIDTLCHKILVNVGHLTHADRASLFLAQGPRHSRSLVAKLFDVTVDTVLEDALSNAAEREILLPWGVGIVGHVANTKEVINIKDAYQDPRFDASIDRRTGYRTMSVLCMPVCNYEGEVIGVAEIINKKNGTNEFTRQDVEVFRRYLTFCGIGIQNAQLYDMSVREYKRNQLLLHLARGIFEEQTSLDRLVTKIMTEARELLKCERCSVYLLDPQTAGSAVDDKKNSSKDNSQSAETLVIRQSVAPTP